MTILPPALMSAMGGKRTVTFHPLAPSLLDVRPINGGQTPSARKTSNGMQ